MNIDPGKAKVKTYNRLHKLPLGSVTARGWLREQLLRSKEGMGGHLDELEPEMIATPFINYSSFKRVPWSTEEADPTFTAGWSSEISGTYWTGLVQLAYTLNDEELIAKAEKWVEGVLRHQEPDGYLGGYPKTTDRNADYNPWGSAWCYRALLAYYEATGRREVLEAVHKGLLWFCENWKEHKTDYAGPVITEPMIITYAYTGDERLVKFSEDWLDWLETNSRWQNSMSCYLSDRLPYGSMHVVAYGEDMKHPAIIYCATGEKRMLDASVNAANKALRRIVQTTGGASSCTEFLSPKGASNETEYCNFSTFNHSYSWLALATGKASWGDEMERCLFNGAEGARKKDERAIAYFTAPNQNSATRDSTLYGGHTDMGVYAPCYYVACCPAQSVRIIPEFVRSMCMEDANGETYIYCYGPASVRSDNIDFEMDTLYPFRETITLRVTRADSAKLHLRIPAWCKAPGLKVNGKDTGLVFDGDGFALIDAALSTGDTVEIFFPMEVKLVRVDDSDSNSKFPVSIERGPLVYAINIPTKWNEYPGRPITELPEGWSWYEARPDMSFAEGVDHYIACEHSPWSKAIDEHLDPSKIKVIERDVSGYVWEEPPVALEVPLYPVEHICIHHARGMYETWGGPLSPTGEAEMCTLVPHGCTNLRVTYIARANVK